MTEPAAETEPRPYSMAVTITLVFSDECHREAWLLRQGALTLQPNSTMDQAVLADYARRCRSQDLVYLVGPLLYPSDADQATADAPTASEVNQQ